MTPRIATSKTCNQMIITDITRNQEQMIALLGGHIPWNGKYNSTIKQCYDNNDYSTNVNNIVPHKSQKQKDNGYSLDEEMDNSSNKDHNLALGELTLTSDCQ
jgi:hypothetical protein